MRAAIIVVAALIAIGHRAEAKGCHETSFVVGHEHCSHFGLWSRDDRSPRLTIDMAYFHQAFANPTGATIDGALNRVVLGLGPIVYAGLEFGAGATHASDAAPQPVAFAAAPEAGKPPSMVGMVGRGVVGAHVSLFRFALGAELASGGRWGYYAGVGGVTRRELVARVRFDVFVHPHASLGIALGRSLLDPDDSQVIISLGIHARAMDGM